MKKELLEKLESLLDAENPFEVQKEFNQLSTQLKSLLSATTPKKEKSSKENEPSAQANAPTGAHEEGEATEAASPSNAPSEKAEKIDGAEKAEPISPQEPEPNATAGDKREEEPSVDAENAPTQLEERKETPDAITDTETAAPQAEKSDKLVESEEQPENREAAHTNDAESKVAEVEKTAPDTAGDEAADHPTADDITVRFKELKKAFKEKVSQAREQLERIEKETVSTAKDLLAEMQNVVENEENIGKAFAAFNAIQDKWKTLPKVSNDNYRDLNVEYNKLLERFFYNINIYKELKDLDLKRNLEEKQKVLEDQKKLLDLNDIRLLEVEVRLNQDRWNEIGPTFKEEWNAIKDEFWGVTRNIYKKIQDFYNLRRAEQDQNLEAKKELLEKVKQINGLQLKAHKKWQEKTKEVIELQKQWKLIGFVPKEQAKPIWKEFRETCDSFFESKRAHYEELHQAHEANKNAKEALLAEAEELKESTDWKDTSDKLIKLQQRWKEIGPAHQRDENRLWRKFRAACDHFFQARKSQKSEAIEEQKENLLKKQAIIDALGSFAPEVGKKESIEKLKEFSHQWREVGHVPFKEKDRISKAYRQLMDEKFAVLKVDKEEKEKIRFEEKIDLLKASDSTDKLVRKEQDFLRSKISKLESEINQYENNLGFFAQSKGAEALKAEVLKKIEKAKEEVERLYDQVDRLNEVE